MGQKVNPNSLRVGINKYWQSTWFEKKDYSNFLKEDHNIRSYIEKNYAIAGISSVIIERAAANLKIIIHTSKPGVLIGKKGADIEKLRNSSVYQNYLIKIYHSISKRLKNLKPMHH